MDGAERLPPAAVLAAVPLGSKDRGLHLYSQVFLMLCLAAAALKMNQSVDSANKIVVVSAVTSSAD
jgi:hypothetical protein